MADQSTTRALPPIDHAPIAVRLVVSEGVDAGESVTVAGTVRVGTSEASELRLSDPTVSRRHLAVEPSPIGARVRDEGSRNGTWLAEARVVEAEIAPGTELRVGGTVLRLERDSRPARKAETGAHRSGFGRFVGEAVAVQPLYEALERVAGSTATILLEGESGTGKELLAEALHEASARSDGPFIVVDCGALPENLIESELFGHERGAFTGADRAHTGAFVRANRGTIFLDEIGELPTSLQTRLLRALDRRRVRPLGSSKEIDVDVRVVAATNRNLDREVEEGRFRLDLFHRLAVVLLRVPPLRERRSDVAILARRFARDFGAEEAVVTDELLRRVSDHPWAGNARELRNWVERLVLLGDSGPHQGGSAHRGDAVATAARSGLPFRQARAQALEAFTNAYVADMLERHDGNVSHAAQAAGIARRYFQKLKQGE